MAALASTVLVVDAVGASTHAPDVDTMHAPEPKSQQLMLPGATAGQAA